MRLSRYVQIAADSPQKRMSINRHGLPITIEYPKGSMRILKNAEGKPVYSIRMANHYGFFNGTKGRDGDEVDCIVGPKPDAEEVFVIHMKDMGPDKDQREDEDKCMVGFASANDAKRAFFQHYPKNFYEGMTALPVSVFKKRMGEASLPHRKKKITAVGALQLLLSGKEAREERTAGATIAARHTEHATSGRRSGAAGRDKEILACPHCGSKKHKLMPTDFETAKCDACGKNFKAGGPQWIAGKKVKAGQNYQQFQKTLVKDMTQKFSSKASSLKQYVL
ncbi:MAG: hypothetical protein KGL39_39445, partial [Patescibacteria group bacterium]|nr:hypothetical protein [Patescibacteria group bacterium]